MTATLYCPACGYNLTGLTGAVCPECGEGFDTEALASEQRGVRTVGRLCLGLLVTPALLGIGAALLIVMLALIVRIGFGRGAVIGLMTFVIVLHAGVVSGECVRAVTLKRGRVNTPWFFGKRWPCRVGVTLLELFVAAVCVAGLIRIVSLFWVN